MTPPRSACRAPCARCRPSSPGAQVGITLTNLGIGFLSEPAIADLIDEPLGAAGLPDGAVTPVALAVALSLSTIVTMLFGELVPKNLAIALPLATARATQAPMRFFTAANKGPIRVLNGAANALVRRLGVEPQEELRSARSSTELASLIAALGRRGHPRRRHRRADGALGGVRHPHRGRDHDARGCAPARWSSTTAPRPSSS